MQSVCQSSYGGVKDGVICKQSDFVVDVFTKVVYVYKK